MKLLLLIALVLFAFKAQAHAYDSIIAAANARHLPTKMLLETRANGAKIAIKSTNGGPMYKPGWFSGGTIYLPFANKSPSNWGSIDWANFYNEAFHAWWGNVFVKSSKYKAQKNLLTSNRSLIAKYKRANPRKPILAMEEGYSETISSVILYANPRPTLDPDTGRYILVPADYHTLYYKIGRTISAVSHSDRPGYTPAAESTYPDTNEYNNITNWVFGKNAPVAP